MKRPPRSRPEVPPHLVAGYAYELELPESQWKSAGDDSWAIVVIDRQEADNAFLLGMRTIDGTRCRVFAAHNGRTYAQARVAGGGGYR